MREKENTQRAFDNNFFVRLFVYFRWDWSVEEYKSTIYCVDCLHGEEQEVNSQKMYLSYKNVLH
jgi:hypothetical protein